MLSISSCNTNIVDEPMRLSRDDVPNAPALPTADEVTPEYTSEGISVEIVDDEKSYRQNFSTIDIKVCRDNGNKDEFYYYRHAYIQVLAEDGTWQNSDKVTYNAVGYPDGMWLCSKDGQGFLEISNTQIFGELEVGRYRAVVFVGSDASPICDYFDITE